MGKTSAQELKLFGTDGIRARANTAPLTPENLQRLAAAFVLNLRLNLKNRVKPRLLLASDTRKSSPMMRAALSAGASACGADIVDLGVAPTPALGYLCAKGESIFPNQKGFDGAIMVTASHNPAEDNGVKFIAGNGRKLNDGEQAAIESEFFKLADDKYYQKAMLDGLQVGEIWHEASAIGFYKRSLQKTLRVIDSEGFEFLSGLRIVIDCAHGATYLLARELFAELECGIEVINTDPNGSNINKDCGAAEADILQKLAKERGADLLIAFDGDGDRILVCDERARLFDGDKLMAILLSESEEYKTEKIIVGTLMTTMGMEIFCRQKNIGLERAPVGDSYVGAKMRELGARLGGETSGHIIDARHCPIGDALHVACSLLLVLASGRKRVGDFYDLVPSLPNILRKVAAPIKLPLAEMRLAALIKDAERDLANSGRTLVRYSGTEDFLRILVEGKDESQVQKWADTLCHAAEEELKEKAN